MEKIIMLRFATATVITAWKGDLEAMLIQVDMVFTGCKILLYDGREKTEKRENAIEKLESSLGLKRDYCYLWTVIIREEQRQTKMEIAEVKRTFLKKNGY